MYRARFVIVADEERHCQFNDVINYSIYNPIRSLVEVVAYEALEDYVCSGRKALDDNILSAKFYKYLDYLWQKNEWSEEKIIDLVDGLKIYYTDGYVRCAQLDFDQMETVSGEVFQAYSYGESGGFEDFLTFEDIDGADVYVNMQNVSMLELPFLKVETAIYNAIKELIGEETNG